MYIVAMCYIITHHFILQTPFQNEFNANWELLKKYMNS